MITIEGNQLLLDGKPVGNIDVPIGTTDHQRLLAWSKGNSPDRIEIKDLREEISELREELGEREDEVEDLESDVRGLEHDVKVLKKAISDAQKDLEWQPIETAPESGSIFLFVPDEDGGFACAGNKPKDGIWRSLKRPEERIYPTHWMMDYPEPKPPEPAHD